MADNLSVPLSATKSIAADDISSVWYQRVKLSLGADGAAVDAVAGSGSNGTGVQRVTVATDDALTVAAAAINTKLALDHTGHYETVAASQTDQALGATGGAGDWLEGVLIIPANTSPGAVLIEDATAADFAVFAGGASSVADLKPFYVPIKAVSVAGAWTITTGADVSAIAFGKFT